MLEKTMIKVYVVVAEDVSGPTVDSVHRWKIRAIDRRMELQSTGDYLNVQVVEKEME